MGRPNPTSFDSGTNTANASSYLTASKTFLAGKLYFLSVYASVASGSITPPTVTLNVAGTAWAAVTSLGSAGLRAMTTVAFIPVADVTDQVKIDYGAQAITGIDWGFVENISYKGPNPSDSIRQLNGTNGTSGTPSVALGVAPLASSRVFAVIGNQGNVAVAPGANFTELLETVGHATPSSRLEVEVDTSASQQTADWTQTSNAFIAQIFELLTGDVSIQAVAAAATALAVAPAPSAGVTIAAPSATAIGGGVVPSASAGATLDAPASTATADAVAPTVSAGAAISSPAALATADAPAPVIGVGATVVSPTALATGLAPPPVVGAGATVAAPAAGASGAAIPPAIASGHVLGAPAAVAAAAAIPPALSVGTVLDAPRAVATGSAPAPGVSAGVTVSSPAATAVAAAPAPVLFLPVIIAAPAATAFGAAIPPTLALPVILFVTDNLTLGLSESSLPSKLIPVTDTLTLGLDDVADRSFLTDVSDTLILGLTESSLRKIPVDKFAADTLTLGFLETAAVVVRLSNIGVRTSLPRGLGTIRHTVQGMIVPFDQWEAIESVGEAAGGYLSAIARIPWSWVEKYSRIFRYGSIVRSFHVPTGIPVSAGMMLEPAPAEGQAEITVVGWGQVLSEVVPRRLWQNADPAAWVARDTPPHNFAIQGDIQADIQSGKIRLFVPEGTIVNTDDRNGVIFNGQGNPITRFAGTIELNRVNAGSYTLTVDTAAGPSGALTQRKQWVLNASIGDFEVEFDNGTDDILVWTLRFNGAGGGAATYLSCKLTNPRVNGMAVGDVYSPSSVVRDVFSLEGITPNIIDEIGGNILPLDVANGAKGDPAVRAGLLGGAYHGIWDTGHDRLGIFQPWGSHTWSVPQLKGIHTIPLARYDRVAVPYTDGVTDGLEIVNAPYDLDTHRTFQVELTSERPNQDTAHEIGVRLAPYLVEQHFGGVADLLEVLDSQGIPRSAHLLKSGHDLIVPRAKEPLRIVELRRTQRGPVEATFADTLLRVNELIVQAGG